MLNPPLTVRPDVIGVGLQVGHDDGFGSVSCGDFEIAVNEISASTFSTTSYNTQQETVIAWETRRDGDVSIEMSP